MSNLNPDQSEPNCPNKYLIEWCDFMGQQAVHNGWDVPITNIKLMGSTMITLTNIARLLHGTLTIGYRFFTLFLKVADIYHLDDDQQKCAAFADWLVQYTTKTEKDKIVIGLRNGSWWAKREAHYTKSRKKSGNIGRKRKYTFNTESQVRSLGTYDPTSSNSNTIPSVSLGSIHLSNPPQSPASYGGPPNKRQRTSYDSMPTFVVNNKSDIEQTLSAILDDDWRLWSAAAVGTYVDQIISGIAPNKESIAHNFVSQNCEGIDLPSMNVNDLFALGVKDFKLRKQIITAIKELVSSQSEPMQSSITPTEPSITPIAPLIQISTPTKPSLSSAPQRVKIVPQTPKKKAIFRIKRKVKKAKKVEWFDSEELYQKCVDSKVSSFKTVWKKDWRNVQKGDEMLGSLTEMEATSLACVIKGKPLSLEEIHHLFKVDFGAELKLKNLKPTPSRTKKVIKAKKGIGYNFGDSDNAELMKDTFALFVSKNTFFKSLK